MAGEKPDWWKTLFDETYLITDARSVCDEALTCSEVDFLEQALGLEKSWPILDLCGGQGRHSRDILAQRRAHGAGLRGTRVGRAWHQEAAADRL